MTRLNKVSAAEVLYVSGIATWLRVDLKTGIYETIDDPNYMCYEKLIGKRPQPVLIPLIPQTTAERTKATLEVEKTKVKLLRQVVETARIGPFSIYLNIYEDSCEYLFVKEEDELCSQPGGCMFRVPVVAETLSVSQVKQDNVYKAYCPPDRETTAT